MTYNMFLDDERCPGDVTWVALWEHVPFVIVRSVPEALDMFAEFGCPDFITFDHDLGKGAETGYDLVKHMVNMDLDSGGTFIPEHFQFKVHSKNPIGANNIEKMLTNYLKIA